MIYYQMHWWLILIDRCFKWMKKLIKKQHGTNSGNDKKIALIKAIWVTCSKLMIQASSRLLQIKYPKWRQINHLLSRARIRLTNHMKMLYKELSNLMQLREESKVQVLDLNRNMLARDQLQATWSMAGKVNMVHTWKRTKPFIILKRQLQLLATLKIMFQLKESIHLL